MFPKNRKPTHPGIILEEEFLKPLELTPKRFAEILGGEWNELKITAIIKGQEGISEKTAHAFAAALNTSPEFWIRLSKYYVQWEHVHRENEKGSHKGWKKAQ